jgi:hypothetical protein
VDPLLVAFVGSGAAALVAFAVHRWRDDDARRTRRVLRKARVVPISQLTDGQLACVVGRVERDGVLIDSMMEGRPCVAFDTITHVVEREDFAAPVSTKSTRHLVPFFVVDATGRVRVDAPQAALCNKPSAKASNWVERIVEEGDTVRLVGSVVLDPAARDAREHGFREGAWTATLTGTAKFPLLIDVVG